MKPWKEPFCGINSKLKNLPSLLVIVGTGFFWKSILDSFKRGLLNEFNITKILVLARSTDKFKLEFPEFITNGVELINGDISTIKTLSFSDVYYGIQEQILQKRALIKQQSLKRRKQLFLKEKILQLINETIYN
jgi:hypothetical protein